MKINDILNRYEHRNTHLPEGDWLFYQEWNNAIFLHWDVSIEELRPWIPRGLEIDTFDGYNITLLGIYINQINF